MNMVLATGGSGGLPTSFTSSVGSSQNGLPLSDSNWTSIIHALAISAAFILLMPIGALFLRVIPGSVRWHWVNQTVATVLAIIGGGVGLYLSSMFTKSESYTSGHQILGYICVVMALLQWSLGYWHHRVYKMTQQPTKYGSIHRYLGLGVIVLAILNGGIGLTWSYASTGVVIGYAIAVVVISVGVMIALVWKRMSTARNKPWTSTEPGGQWQSDSGEDIRLTRRPSPS